MKMMAFNAACPLEIGDEIFVIGNNAYYLAPEVKITQRLWDALCTQAEKRRVEDIATTMYCKSGGIEFSYKLNGDQVYKKLNVAEVTN